MAVIYTNPDNKPFSSWIVSDEERDIVLKYSDNEHEQKKSMNLFSKNVEKVRLIMSTKQNV